MWREWDGAGGVAGEAADESDDEGPPRPVPTGRKLRWPRALFARQEGMFRTSNGFKNHVLGATASVTRLEPQLWLEGHTGCVNCLAFSPDGSIIASGSDDTLVKLWDLDKGGECMLTLPGHVSNVFAVAFAGSSAHLVSGGNDSDVRFVDMTRGAATVYRHHTRKVLRVSVDPQNPKLFLTCSTDGTVRQFDVRCPYEDSFTHDLGERDESMPSTGVLPQAFGGGRLVDVSPADMVTESLVLDYHTRSETMERARGGSMLYSVDHHPLNSNLFCVASSDGNVRLYDQRSIRDYSPDSYVNIYRSHRMQYPPDCRVSGARFNHDGSQVVSTHVNEVVYAFDTTKNFEVDEQIDYHDFSRDSAHLMRGVSRVDGPLSDEEVASMQDQAASTGMPMQRVILEHLTAHMLSYESEGPISAFMGNNALRMGDYVLNTQMTYRQRFRGHLNVATLKGVNFLGPRSEFVVSGSDDGGVFIWDSGTGEVVAIKDVHSGAVNVVESHPSGFMLATSGIDHYAVVWGVEAMGRDPQTEDPECEHGDRIMENALEASQARTNAAAATGLCATQ